MNIKNHKETIIVPESVKLSLNKKIVTVKGEKGEVSKEFKMPRFVFNTEGNKLIITCNGYNVYDRRNFCTIKAHIKNMVHGVNNGYVYYLKICSSHFPMNVTISKNKFVVKNLLGEKVPRELKIKEGVTVTINGTEIELKGIDLEKVSTAASDMEQLTRNTARDRRIFQDGIYIIKKDGKEL
jgi:large subunit ribosomal protein L6